MPPQGERLSFFYIHRGNMPDSRYTIKKKRAILFALKTQRYANLTHKYLMNTFNSRLYPTMFIPRRKASYKIHTHFERKRITLATIHTIDDIAAAYDMCVQAFNECVTITYIKRNIFRKIVARGDT